MIRHCAPISNHEQLRDNASDNTSDDVKKYMPTRSETVSRVKYVPPIFPLHVE